MRKAVLVLVMALGLIGCTTDEVPAEVVEVSNLIEQMESSGLYERISNEDGLRVRRGQRISQIFKSNSEDCFIEQDLNTDEFNLITSNENTYSYRVRMGSGTIYQYAFRSNKYILGDLTLTIYSYDEVEEQTSFLSEIGYLKRTVEFNICN
tara:strand:+ start:367 stop:819 length:453 start_codon:yes stop_codon:yes gene_type:complete